MKEKNTEKETVFGPAEDPGTLQGHFHDTLTVRGGGLGPILNSAMNSFYVFGPIISFSRISVFL